MEKTHDYVYNRTKVVQKKAKKTPAKPAAAKKAATPRQTPSSTPLENPLPTPNIDFYSNSTSPRTIEASPVDPLYHAFPPLPPAPQSISPAVIQDAVQQHSYFDHQHQNGYLTPAAAVMAMNQRVHHSPHIAHSPHMPGSGNYGGNFHDGTLLESYEQSPSSDEEFVANFLGDAPDHVKAMVGGQPNYQQQFAGYPVVEEPFDHQFDEKIATYQ